MLTYSAALAGHSKKRFSFLAGFVVLMVVLVGLLLPAMASADTWHYVGEGGEPAFESGWFSAEGGAPNGFRFTLSDSTTVTKLARRLRRLGRG